MAVTHCAAASIVRPGSARNRSGVKSQQAEGQESLGKDGKRWEKDHRIDQSCRGGCSAHPWLQWGTEKLGEGTKDVPRTEWPWAEGPREEAAQ